MKDRLLERLHLEMRSDILMNPRKGGITFPGTSLRIWYFISNNVKKNFSKNNCIQELKQIHLQRDNNYFVN